MVVGSGVPDARVGMGLDDSFSRYQNRGDRDVSDPLCTMPTARDQGLPGWVSSRPGGDDQYCSI